MSKRLLAHLLSATLSLTGCSTTMNAEEYFDGPARELAVAIQRNQLEQAQRLLTTVDLNRLYRENMTFVMWCIINQRKEALEWVLQHGANPNYEDEAGTTPVGYVARFPDMDYLKILLRYKGDPNSRSGKEIALTRAALAERWENMVYLLDHGANINGTDADGNTLAMTLAGLNFFDKVAYLIDRGADVHYTDSLGASLALNVQEANPNPGTENYKWQQIVRQKLIGKGVKFPVPRPWEQRQQQQDQHE